VLCHVAVVRFDIDNTAACSIYLRQIFDLYIESSCIALHAAYVTYLCRETCVGSSDDVVIPIEEFRSLIDGAVRIARFDVSATHS
jgi:hypothetical protein